MPDIRDNLIALIRLVASFLVGLAQFVGSLCARASRPKPSSARLRKQAEEFLRLLSVVVFAQPIPATTPHTLLPRRQAPRSDDDSHLLAA